jgi:16S rRNA (cytidine1402-2'-O)-methyltransferase
MSEPAGVLVLVGTPLGNRGDLSPRARQAILDADLLLCEDTRSPLRLLGDGSQLPPRLSCFVGNEHERVTAMLEALAQGKRVAFVSEAGLPVWSDPGQLLVSAAIEAGHEVDVVPGPTAASVALAASGFAAQSSLFLGFLPRTGKDRTEALAQVEQSTGPIIIYEAGNRVGATFADLEQRIPDRRAVVARELTKAHQEVFRGTVAELRRRTQGALKGEVTVVIDGAPIRAPQADVSTQAARKVMEALLDEGLKPRERAKAVAALTGLDDRDVYDRLVRAKD